MTSEQSVSKPDISAPATTTNTSATTASTTTTTSTTTAPSTNTPSSLPNPPKSSNQQPFVPHNQQQYNPNHNNHKGQYISNNNYGGRMNNNYNNNNNTNNKNNHRNNNNNNNNNYRNHQIPNSNSIPYGYQQGAPMMVNSPYYSMPYPIPQQNLPISDKPLVSQPHKHVPIVIKTKDGKEVQLPNHRKNTSISSIPNIPSVTAKSNDSTINNDNSTNTINSDKTLPVKPATSSSSTTTTTITSTPSSSAPVVTAPPAKTSSSKLSFQEQFQAQLRKKKEAAAAAKAAAEAAQNNNTATPAATAPTSEEKTESKPEPVAEVPKETVEEPKVEEKVEAKVETPVEATPVTETKPVESTPATETKPVETSEPAKETTEEVETTEKEESKTSETTETTENAEETKADETTEEPEEEEEEDNRISISEFMDRIANAKSITKPQEFEYPEKFTGPSTSADAKIIKYDPMFLYQFQNISLKLDDKWKAEHVSKIYIPDKESREKSFKNRDSRARSNGPMRGSALRNGSEFDGRNSRMGSKKKGRDSGRQGSRRGGDKDNSRRSRNGRPGEKSEKADDKPKISLEDAKPLEKAANRWVPKIQAKVEKPVKYAPDGVTVIIEGEELEKKVRSLLNKLSLEKFDTIGGELIKLANQSLWEDDLASLKTVVKATFAKATDEPHWSSMYAQFCQKLLVETDPNIETTTDDGKKIKGSGLTYNLLVTRCQAEYSKGWSVDLPVNEDGSPIEPELMSDEYYALAAQKRRGLGLVRFIGELYRLKIIRQSIIIRCIKMLTTDQSENPVPFNEYLPQEDTLETLYTFLLTVGSGIDGENPAICDNVFALIKIYIENPKIGSRIKYKFYDLIDLRKSKWSSSNELLQGPKKLSQVHQDFNQQAQQEKQKLNAQERERSNKSRSIRGSSNNSRWGSEQISSNDISRVGIVRKTGTDNSINALRKGKIVQDDFTTVSSSRSRSSRGFGAVSRSNSSANVQNTEEEQPETRQQSNNFNLLMNQSDEEKDDSQPEQEEDEEEEGEDGEDEEESKEEAAEAEEAKEEAVEADAEQPVEKSNDEPINES